MSGTEGRLRSIDPTTGRPLQEHPEHDDAEVHARLDAAVAAYEAWRRLDVEARAPFLERLAAGLEERRDPLVAMVTAEMGKPTAQARAEVGKAAATCRFYAEQAARLLAPEPVAFPGAARSYVCYRPLGPVLAILPWNFPVFQAIRGAAPALMAGNAVVIKHSPEVCGVAAQLEEVLVGAGFPAGLTTTLRLSNERVAPVIRDPRIAAVTFCGSPRAGRIVAAEAGSVLKKIVLELGGCDPYVVLPDADLDLAVEETVKSRLINAGQSCIGAKRCLVAAEVAPAFEARLRRRLAQVVVGDPRDPATDVGPLARASLRDQLQDQVDRSVRAGARLVLGGRIPEGAGFFYPVTLLADVTPDQPAFREELFGPVFSVTPVDSEAEALRLANASDYGLGAALFTGDTARGEALAADHLEAGSCFVNAFVRSDACAPFGGVKHSGFGRELGGHGLRELTAPKTVFVA